MKISDIRWPFLVLLICIIKIDGKSIRRSQKKNLQIRKHIEQYHAKHDFGINMATRNGSSDPEVNKRVSQMARFIVHKSTWAPIATLSSDVNLLGQPFNQIKSMVDGPIGNSTGTPYFYLSPKDFVAEDLAENSFATITLTLDERGYCRNKGLDPEDTSCPKVIIVGSILKLDEDTEEYQFAQDALFKRHPSMKTWPKDYDYFVAKMEITDVVLFYKTREAQCAPIPVYFEEQPKFISEDKL